MQALGVVEVVGAGRAVPGRRLGRAGQDEPEPPPLVGAVALEAAVALADLEQGDVVAALADVALEDLERGCRAGSGA